MALPRKHIPLETRLRVALTQLGELWVAEEVKRARDQGRITKTLEEKLDRLAALFNCTRKELRLDHNPALGLRRKIKNRAGVIVRYEPDELDPRFLIYRSHADHHRKTNIRGDGAQFSDTVLMKRERKRQKKASGSKTSAKLRRPKQKWPIGRKIESRGFR